MRILIVSLCLLLITLLTVGGQTAPAGTITTPASTGESHGDSPYGFDRTPILPLVFLSTGLFFFESGSLIRSVNVGVENNLTDAWEAYALFGEQNRYEDYSDLYYLYRNLSITSFSVWGGGALILSTVSFQFPEPTFFLSTRGRAVFGASLCLGVVSNILIQWSDNQGFQNQQLWERFAVTGNPDDEETYRQGYAFYRKSRLLSATFGALSGVGMAASFLMPGESRPVASSPLDKLLIAGGVALLTGGNLSQSAAHRAQGQMESLWERYVASADIGLRDEYEASYERYLTNTFLTYGLWTAGGAAVLAAVVFDLEAAGGGILKNPKKFSLFLRPEPSGWALGAGIEL